MSHPDVAVVGGGIIGSSIAWRLASAGAAVTLIDDPSRQAAAEVAAGMLAPVTEASFGEERLLQLNLRSLEMYPAFVEELERLTGTEVGFHASGTLMVARDTDDLAVLAEIFDYQKGLGLTVDRLSSRGARDLEPLLAPGVRGAFVVPGDHHVDPAGLLAALRKACAAAGVRTIEDRVVEVLQEGSGRVAQLESNETVPAAVVVIAAGCWSGLIEGIANGPDVRPVKGQLVHLRANGDALPTRTIRGVDVYIVSRRDGRVVIGATVEEKGFDATPTADAAHNLLRDAHELVPALLELEFRGVTAGLRPGSRANSPTIGELEPGLIVATGHFRNGVLLAPSTADAVAQLVAGTAPRWIEPFTPRQEVVA